MKTGPKPRTLIEAYQHLLDTCVEDNGCKLITYGHPVSIGYRRIRAEGRDWYIHELSYFFHHGKMPKGLVHRHTCHRPNCFEPTHIIAGTHADNVADKVRAGRSQKGVGHYKAVLTEDDVRAIRKSDLNLGELSRLYGISRGGILKIRRRESWKHVIDSEDFDATL